MKLILIILMNIIAIAVFSQKYIAFQVSQPPTLEVNAGKDTTIFLSDSIELGSLNTALYGYGSYIYNWYPTTGINNPVSANPKASPDISTMYYLTVSDSLNCIAEDSVLITIDTATWISFAENMKLSVVYNANTNTVIIKNSNKESISNINIKIHASCGKIVENYYLPILRPDEKKLLQLKIKNKGLYIVSIVNKNIYKNIKIIK